MQNKFAKNISTVSWQMIALAAVRAGQGRSLQSELNCLSCLAATKWDIQEKRNLRVWENPKGGVINCGRLKWPFCTHCMWSWEKWNGVYTLFLCSAQHATEITNIIELKIECLWSVTGSENLIRYNFRTIVKLSRGLTTNELNCFDEIIMWKFLVQARVGQTCH